MPQAEQSSGTIERLLVIKAMPLFADVLPEDLTVLAEHARLQAFHQGEVLFSGTEKPTTAIHMVLRGTVVESRAGRPFRTYGRHSIVGGIDALARSSVDVVATADQDTQTLSIERAALADILEDNFAVLWVTLQGVAAATLRTRRRLPSAGFADQTDMHDTDVDPPDDLATRIAFLRRHSGFGAMKVRTLAELVREAEVVTPRAGEGLWSAGDSAEHAVIVVHGTIACATPEGQRFEAGHGTMLGLEEALAMDARWYGASTLGPAAYLSITRTAFIDALEDDADSAVEALAAMATVASRLRDRLARDRQGNEEATARTRLPETRSVSGPDRERPNE